MSDMGGKRITAYREWREALPAARAKLVPVREELGFVDAGGEEVLPDTAMTFHRLFWIIKKNMILKQL